MNGIFDLSWMAWTWPTVAFFIFILLSIVGMAVWERFSPGGAPRKGILRIDTTRGDRLFISYLTAGFVHLAWIGFIGLSSLWGALVLSIVLSVAIFKWV
jgi:predicted small integral membrane protein